MPLSVYISAGFGLVTLLISLGAIVYRSGSIEARLDQRLAALELRINSIPNIPAEFVARPDCERRTSDFCRKIELVRTEIRDGQSKLLDAMNGMDDKREKARAETDEVARQMAGLRAAFDEHLRRLNA